MYFPRFLTQTHHIGGGLAACPKSVPINSGLVSLQLFTPILFISCHSLLILDNNDLEALSENL